MLLTSLVSIPLHTLVPPSSVNVDFAIISIPNFLPIWIHLLCNTFAPASAISCISSNDISSNLLAIVTILGSAEYIPSTSEKI